MKLTEDPVAVLVAHATLWGTASLATRADELANIRRRAAEVAADWVETACRHKGIAPGSTLAGEEWQLGPYALISYVQELERTLRRADQGRDPWNERDLGYRSGRVTVAALPAGPRDRWVLAGYRAETWLHPGKPPVGISRDDRYAVSRRQGYQLALVLGAGNVASIPAMDVLYQLYAYNRATLLKLNPVNDYLAPYLRHAFAGLTSRGALAIITGDSAAGADLVCDERFDAVHVTGSTTTFRAIEATLADHRAADAVVLTGELGGVSPVILAPGRWRDSDLRFQAMHVATQRLHNAGSNCIATQIVVLPEAWPQKHLFLRYLRQAMADAPTRPAYYPGSSDRLAAAAFDHEQVEQLGTTEKPRLLITADPADAAPIFTDEYFAPVLGVVELPGEGPADYLARATEFANDRLAGTLGASILVDPSTRNDTAVEKAVRDLRFGAIAINCWTALGYSAPRLPWGAYGHDEVDNRHSGIGAVHNAMLLAGTERAVVEGPFRPVVHPPWLLNHPTADSIGRHLTDLAAGRVAAAAPLAVAALRASISAGHR